MIYQHPAEDILAGIRKYFASPTFPTPTSTR